MSRAIRRALDAAVAGMVVPAGPRAPSAPCPVLRRDLSILQALDWAFRVEFARLEFDEGADGARAGVSTVWVMMQRGAIGCQIDGGGVSAAHDDAQIIASYLAALPVARGGRGMAAYIASLARSGLHPDWMQDLRPRCVPREWTQNQHGPRARAEVLRSSNSMDRGRKVERDEHWCPVMYTPSAAQIGAARRNYLDWWGALLDLRGDLIVGRALRTIRLTRALPPLNPWLAPDDAIGGLDDTGT